MMDKTGSGGPSASSGRHPARRISSVLGDRQEDVETKALDRCVVVIPALDPDGTLPGFAASLLEQGAEQIVVVDDGSREDCRGIFQALEALEGCTVLRHQVNQGKGRAMKDAFAYISGQERWTGCAVVTAGVNVPRDVVGSGRAIDSSMSGDGTV